MRVFVRVFVCVCCLVALPILSTCACVACARRAMGRDWDVESCGSNMSQA